MITMALQLRGALD